MTNGPFDRDDQPPPSERATAPTESKRQRPLSPDDIRPNLHRPWVDAPPSAAADTPPAFATIARPRGQKFRKSIAILLFAALAWTAWAAAALFDLTTGLRNADPVALERRIDWASVRQGLREDLRARLAPQSRDSTIEALVSQKGVANLLRIAKVDDRGWDTTAPESQQQPALEWRRIRYAFFSGGPFAFRVDIGSDDDQPRPPLVLLFRWTGDWRLTRVFLPAEASEPAAGALGSRPQPSSAAPDPRPLPPGAQKAALYEENPSEPRGRRYAGSATWRVEQIPPIARGASDIAVTIRISMPERPLGLTLSIRRNFDQTLPASHTMEVKFDPPPDSTTRGIIDVAGITMKSSEDAAGQQLASSSVKVSDDFFLIGLSAIDLDVRHNTQLLKDRAWLGILFTYKNGSRAVLAIEKGDTGQKSIDDAFARWDAIPVMESGQKR